MKKVSSFSKARLKKQGKGSAFSLWVGFIPHGTVALSIMGKKRGPPGPWQGALAPGPVVELHGTPPPLNDTAGGGGRIPRRGPPNHLAEHEESEHLLRGKWGQTEE